MASLDTLTAAKELRAAGFSEVQAEALTRQLQQAQDLALSNLATKADLTVLVTKADLKDELARFATKADLTVLVTKADLKDELARFATKADLAETKADILKWVFGAIGLQTLAIIGAVLALLRTAGAPTAGH